MTPHDISMRSHSNSPTPKVLILHLFSSPPPQKSPYYTYSPPPTLQVPILHLFSSPHPASPHITPILLPPPHKSSYYTYSPPSHPLSPHITPILLPPLYKSSYYTYSPPPTPQVPILHLFSSPHSTGPFLPPTLRYSFPYRHETF